MKNYKKNLIILIIFLIIFFLISVLRDKKKEQVNNISPGNFLSDNIREIDESDYVLGAKKAKLSIIIYEDVSNYFTAELDKTIKLIRDNFPKQVKIAFRPYANKSFPFSIDSNLFTLCAGEQDKFFEAREFFLSTVENGEMSGDDFDLCAEELGLDKGKMEKCLRSEDKLKELEDIIVEAESFEVFGSPTIFIGSERISGARPFEDYIDSENKERDGLKTIISRHLEY